MSFTQRYRLSKSIRATYYLSTHISALFTQMGKHLYVVLFPLINCDYAIFYSHPDKICVHITGIVIYAIFYSHPDKTRPYILNFQNHHSSIFSISAAGTVGGGDEIAWTVLFKASRSDGTGC